MIKPPTEGGRSDGIYLYITPSGQFVISSNRPVVKATGALVSTNTPGFLSKTKYYRKYEAPFKPFAYTRNVVTFTPGVWGEITSDGREFLNAMYSRSGLGSYFYEWDPASEGIRYRDAGSEKLALSRLQDRVQRMSVNLAMAFAERKQAANMLTKRIGQVVLLANAVKSGNYKAASRLLDSWKLPKPSREARFKQTSNNLGNYWLEYQYGWRPLLSDIRGSAELIADSYGAQKPTRFTSSATVRANVNGRYAAGSLGAGYGFDEGFSGSYVETTRYVLEVIEDGSTLQVLSQTGISNPMLLAWELVPYSFVVDWFLPVGDYLKQLTYAQGLSFKRGTVTRRTEINGSSSMTKRYESSSGGTPILNGLGRNVKQYSKVRTVLSGFPYSSFPVFEPKFGVERALSSISLLAQTFGRKSAIRF